MTSEATRDQWAEWLLSRRHGGDPEKYAAEVEGMHPLRDHLLERAQIAPGETVLDVGTGDGLIAFGALEQVGPAGRVIFSDISRDLLEFCRGVAGRRGLLGRCRFVQTGVETLTAVYDTSVDVVTVRSVLIYVAEKRQAFEAIYRVLRPGGRLSLFEPINSFDHPEPEHLFRGYDVTPVQGLAAMVRALYRQIQPPETDPMLNFDERDLLAWAEEAGFRRIHMEYQAHIAAAPAAYGWEGFLHRAANPRIPSLAEAMEQALTPRERAEFTRYLRPLVENQPMQIRGASVFLQAVKE